MAKYDLTTMSAMELCTLSSKDVTMTADIAAEFERRNAISTAPVSDGKLLVDWNSAGQVFLMETTPTTPTKRGGLHCGQANIAATVLKLIVAETADGAEVRKACRELMAQDKDTILARVAEKKAKKDSRTEKEIHFERQTIVKAVKAGRMSQSTLDDFDRDNGTSDE